MHNRRAFIERIAISAGAVQLGVASSVAAQTTSGAKIIVGFAPGGQTDLFARTVAQGIQQRSSQVVTVENRPGAGGIIGLQGLLGAPADGTTMLLATPATLIAPMLQRRSMDVLADIEPIALLASGGSLVLVNEKVPVTDLASFVSYAKQHPGKLTYASNGPGSAGHLFTEYFKAQLGVDLMHVPYKGGAPAAMAIRTGEVDVIIIDEANAAPLMKEGKVRALAQTGLAALESFPRLARVADVVAGFDASFWMGIVVKRGTPAATVDRLHQLVSSIVQTELREPAKRAGLSIATLSRTGFAEFMVSERDKWLGVIRANNITSS